MITHRTFEKDLNAYLHSVVLRSRSAREATQTGKLVPPAAEQSSLPSRDCPGLVSGPRLVCTYSSGLDSQVLNNHLRALNNLLYSRGLRSSLTWKIQSSKFLDSYSDNWPSHVGSSPRNVGRVGRARDV